MPLAPANKVTVCIICFNQAEFIRHTVESVLHQVTSFPFDVVVADDASSDGSVEILEEIAAKHPGAVRLLRQERNIGPGPNFIQLLDQARGEYIAYCDGDDIWMNPHKLQRQVDFLDAHPECVGCFGRADIIDAQGRVTASYEQVFSYAPRETFDEEYILQHSAGAPMSSIVFRAALWPQLPAWFRDLPYHSALLLALSRFGSWGFLDEVLTYYRIHQGGTYSLRSPLQRLASVAAISRRMSEDSRYDRYRELRREQVGSLAFRMAWEAFQQTRSERDLKVIPQTARQIVGDSFSARHLALLTEGVGQKGWYYLQKLLKTGRLSLSNFAPTIRPPSSSQTSSAENVPPDNVPSTRS